MSVRSHFMWPCLQSC